MLETYANGAIGILSAAILFATGLCVITNSNSKNRLNRSFLVIISLIFVMSLAETVSWIYDGHSELIPLLDLANFMVFLLPNIAVWFLSHYLVLLLGERTKVGRYWYAVITTPAVLSILLLIADRFFHFYYFITPEGVYVQGELYLLSALLPIASLFIDSVVLLRYRKFLGKDAFLLATAYFLLPIMLVTVQMLPNEGSYLWVVLSSSNVMFTLLAVLIYGGIQSQIGKRLSEKLTAVAVEKERVSTELGIATDIQASMLPRIFPPFPEREEIDLFASMKPAKEVGGDFYDFFMASGRLWCVMADVSGKGVPAALFMVIGKTLIKTAAQSGLAPCEVLGSVNTILCEGNDANLFITVFIGALDLSTGEFTCANAGHNAPLLAENGSWTMRRMRTPPNLPLALYDDISYDEESFVLEPGDKLFLYTDGITEAFNGSDEMYGDHRLLEAAGRIEGTAARGFAEGLKKDLDAFVGGAEQSDDITMLALFYKGKNSSTIQENGGN